MFKNPEAKSIILAAIITGLCGVIGAFGPTLLQKIENVQATETAATATRMALAIQTASTPVSRNGNWLPLEVDFDGVAMVLVPAGCFIMGSTQEQVEYYNTLSGDYGVFFETPTNRVCFAEPFWIDKFEVTNVQFRRLNGQATSESNWTNDDRPREQITWFEARNFCALRGARLPSEAEWEYAARGPDSLTYPWGNAFIGDDVVYRGNSEGQTANVGSRPNGLSWIGALDMGGNVWEWTNTLLEPYPYPTDNNGFVRDDGRENMNSDTGQRVLRGGAWYMDDIYTRAAARASNFPDSYRTSLVGFRCTRDAGN